MIKFLKKEGGGSVGNIGDSLHIPVGLCQICHSWSNLSLKIFSNPESEKDSFPSGPVKNQIGKKRKKAIR